MSKLIKIQKPKFIYDLEKVKDVSKEIFNEQKIENKIIENTTISSILDIRVSFDSCMFKNVIFENCDFSKIDMVDVVFENCNLSNTSFRDGSLYRVEFINCKLTGSRFDDSVMKNVLFKGVLGKYLNFSYSKFNGVNIVESNLQSSVLQELKSTKIGFDSSDLSNSIFYGTKLKGIDFTTCNIENIELGVSEIYGSTVSITQALELTRLMGIKIK